MTVHRDYVAIWAAAQLLGRNHRTIRTWVQRQLVAAVRDPARGVLVNRVDVLREHERAMTRQRAPQ